MHNKLTIMKLDVRPDPYAPNLWCVFDEDRKVVKYTSKYKAFCEKYKEEHQFNFEFPKRRKRLHFEDIKNWDYRKINDIYYTNDKHKRLHGILVYFIVLNNEEINYLLHFKNTEILTIKSQYAQEIVYKCIAIYDKCIR